METIDDTGFCGVRLIQDTEGFRYGIDAVLLADFALECCPAAEKAVELGCGNGIVTLLLSGADSQRQVTGVEFQAQAAALARRSAQLNGLENQARFLDCDIARLQEECPDLSQSADLVVSNPPYIASGRGLAAEGSPRQMARQETTADLECFIKAAAWLLRGKGSLCLVHRPFRLVDIFCYCRKYRLEPKRIRFVHPREGEPPNIVLLQCVIGGGTELKYDNPFYVYDTAGCRNPHIGENIRKK